MVFLVLVLNSSCNWNAWLGSRPPLTPRPRLSSNTQHCG